MGEEILMKEKKGQGEGLVGIIGGSIGYELEGFVVEEELKMETPFGVSTDIFRGKLNGEELVFLSRHGKGHVCDPSHVPYRANIYALKKLGCGRVVSVTAVGSLHENFEPGQILIPDQIIDKSYRRGEEASFFGEGIVAHVGEADPFCRDLSKQLSRISYELGMTHSKGCYVCMEGPQFSTRAESIMHKGWGGDVIGMTVSPEYRLCREAEMCYAALAMITDFDVWYPGEEVSVEKVKETIRRNTEKVKEIMGRLVKQEPRECRRGCNRALEGAIQTDWSYVSEEIKEKFRLLAGKYML